MKLSGATAPTPFTSSDIDQVTDYSNNQITISAQNKDLVGTLDMSAINVYYKGTYTTGSNTTYTPSSVNLINFDGSNHTRNRGDLSKIIDGNAGTFSYTTTASTNIGHAPFVLEFGVSTSMVGKSLHKIRTKWGNINSEFFVWLQDKQYKRFFVFK